MVFGTYALSKDDLAISSLLYNNFTTKLRNFAKFRRLFQAVIIKLDSNFFYCFDFSHWSGPTDQRFKIIKYICAIPDLYLELTVSWDINKAIRTCNTRINASKINDCMHNNIHKSITQLWLVHFSTVNPKSQCNFVLTQCNCL